MIVTTAGRTNYSMIIETKRIAIELECDFFKRNDLAITEIHRQTGQDVLVVGKNRLEIYPFNQSSPFFFHPNSAMFRMKRLMRGENDPFIDATNLKEGMSILDCTLGLGSDSIVASFTVGEKGKVVGVEGNPFVAYLVKNGLSQWRTGIENFDQAMKRVEVINENYLAYLKNCEDNQFHVVYFDPMFEETIDLSDGIKGLKQHALYNHLTLEIVNEAKRVASNRVVLKDHFRSKWFAHFGFTVLVRKSSVFHFGYLEKE